MLAAVALAGGTIVAASAADSPSDTTYSFFKTADISRARTSYYTRRSMEVGLRFSSASAGTLESVRFLKARGEAAQHRVTVWSTNGTKLATAMSANESSSGWQEVALAQPLQVQAGQSYVVSYQTSRYQVTRNYFTDALTTGPLSLSNAPGVYSTTAGQVPAQSGWHSNYWVDLVFRPAAGQPTQPTPTQTTASPTATPTSTAPTATPTPTATTTSTPSPTAPTTTPPPGPPGDLNLPRVAWEGGPTYYNQFPQAKADGWGDPNRFPIGVWYESVVSDADVQKDKANGLNTYVELVNGSDMNIVRRYGMSSMVSWQSSALGNENVGWLLGDEVDMEQGPGAGYTEMQRLHDQYPAGDGRMRYANFGKGVQIWENDTDAGKFVNNYTTATSADMYWYTDPWMCPGPGEALPLGVPAATCRRAANYGLTVDRMRYLDGLDGKRQPIYGFVEVGHPFSQSTAPTITADQIGGAVMSSLIHEARGIIYFNHNFGGPCQSQHVLRDSCGAAVRPTVASLNALITSLAPVLNTQSYKWTFNSSVDTMLKAYGGSYYIFAMPGRSGGTGTQTLTLPAGLNGSTAEVVNEGRSVPITGGAIQDNFAQETSYHIYKITP